MNDSFISDSFALATGGSGFTRVNVESQTEWISFLKSRLFQNYRFFIHIFQFENYFDLLRFEPAPVLSDAFDRSATSIRVL